MYLLFPKMMFTQTLIQELSQAALMYTITKQESKTATDKLKAWKKFML